MTHLPNFSHCPKKYQARTDTVIDMYRRYFGQSLPSDKQYWTMCSVNNNGNNIIAHSELGQILDSKLIGLHQYYGVDIESDIIEGNRKAEPNTNWICGDFLDTMKCYYKNNNFNPAIINADFISMSKKAAVITSQIMSFIEEIDIKNVLLIANVMLTNPHARGGQFLKSPLNFEKMISEMESQKAFEFAWSNRFWDMHDKVYCYSGTGSQSRTIMGSYIFYRKGDLQC